MTDWFFLELLAVFFLAADVGERSAKNLLLLSLLSLFVLGFFPVIGGICPTGSIPIQVATMLSRCNLFGPSHV